MSRLIGRDNDELEFGDVLFGVEVPGHHWARRRGPNDPATLYFTPKQLQTLRANVAAAIIKANKRRMELEKKRV